MNLLNKTFHNRYHFLLDMENTHHFLRIWDNNILKVEVGFALYEQGEEAFNIACAIFVNYPQPLDSDEVFEQIHLHVSAILVQ